MIDWEQDLELLTQTDRQNQLMLINATLFCSANEKAATNLNNLMHFFESKTNAEWATININMCVL